jgi:hypothetical protein
MKKPTRTKRSILTRSRNELRRLNLSEKLKRGLSLKGAYYVPKGTKITKQTAYVTVSAWRDAQLGIPHGKAATLRKAGRLGYGAGGEERAIPKSVHTRRSHQEQRAQEQYDRTPTTPIPYFNNSGDVAYDYFWKDNLRIMHNFRDAVAHAKATGDGRGLREYRRKVIITYDGPGLRGYDNKGVRIYPETSLRKILKREDAMTPQEKARFYADINYRHRQEAAE